MQIELPQDLVDRVLRRTASGYASSEADVIRMALDSLDWQDQERLAIQEGIASWHAGETQSLDEFDCEFRSSNGISSDT